jgi:TolA-binding protein
MNPTYKQNLVTTRNANLAEQHDLRERLKQLESEETQLKGAIAILTQIEQAEKDQPEGNKAEAQSHPTT